VRTHDELLDRALILNEQECEDPLPVPEVMKMVRWLWGRKQEGQLWRAGGEARAVLRQSEWEALGPDALQLLTGLRLSHGVEPGKLSR
jgi:hypothetical protein